MLKGLQVAPEPEVRALQTCFERYQELLAREQLPGLLRHSV